MAGRLVYLGLGAALMFLLDPQAGRKRRAGLKKVATSWTQPHWSPAHRALAGGLGAGAASLGYLRGGSRGILLCALGAALLARAAANESLGTLVKGKGFYIEKTIHIDAPVETVYAYWRNREWDAELLNVNENREMTWRSVEGSRVGHTGRVRFEPDGGRTRLHLQLRYSPPLGVIGHVVAKAFGVDPKSGMDRDLLDLKSLVETGQLRASRP